MRIAPGFGNVNAGEPTVEPDDIRMNLVSDPRLLNAVRGLVRGYLATAGITGEKADAVVLAVDEACANSIRHSYGGCCDRRVYLALRREPDWIVIELSDDGVPLDLDRCRKNEFPPAPDKRMVRPGGLGVQLMHRIFDEVIFEPGQKCGNRVTMRLANPSQTDETARRAQDG